MSLSNLGQRGLLFIGSAIVLSAVSANALECPPGGSRPRGPAVQAWRDLAIAKVINGEAAEVQT